MKNETKAKAAKLGAKIILKLTGLELLGEGGGFVYEMGKDYLPEATKNLIDATIDSSVDFFSDEAGDFAKNYLTKREKYVNFHLARAICKIWEENLTASLPKNRAANSKYFLLPQDSFQDFSEQIEFFIKKFKEAQEKGNEHLLVELFYDKEKSEEGFYDTFFTGVQNENSAEDAYWETLEKTLRRWSIVEGKFRYEWKNGFPEDFSRELKKFLFGNLRLGLKEIFDKNEEFRNAFNYSATLLTIKSLQNLPEQIKDQIENAQSENRFGFLQIQERFSKLELNIENISRAINHEFDYALSSETVKRIDLTTQETNEIVKQMILYFPQILEILKNQPKPPEDIFKGLHRSFPRVPNLFTGRVEVLKKLEETLKTENQASFYGTHGLGKTRTAIEYALTHKDEFNFILFISATKGNFESSAAFVGAEISADIEQATSLEAKYNLFINYLQKNTNWLIICDNVEDVSEVAGKIPKHFDGKVIYTSNLREIEDVITPVKIEAMTQTEAELTLLRRKTGNKDAKIEDVSTEEQTAITKIVEKIGTLPIGLILAGAFVKKYQINFREYLHDYEQFEAETFEHFHLADYYGNEFIKNLSEAEKAEYKGIAGVFLFAYKRIIEPKNDSENEKLISETIKAVLNLSVFLAPEKVPEEIWKEGLERIDENLAKATETPMFRLEVRNRLTQSAFFVRNEEDNTSTTHRLILSILQKQLNDAEKRRFAEIVVDSVNSLFPKPYFENWKICNRLLKHAETALDNAEHLQIETQNAARLCNQIAYYVSDLAEYDKAVSFYKRALTIYEKTIGKEQPYYAVGLNNLANVYRSQGKYEEAIELFKEALLIDEKTIGKEHPDYATRLNNLANVYNLQGKYDEAVELYKEALRIDEKTIGKEHLDYATDLNNLALVYNSQGRYDEAIELYKEALLISEKTIGKEHPDYAVGLNNLALVYDLQGKYDEAIELYKEAMLIGENTIGKEHPSYATRLNNLASVYENQGKITEALGLFNQSLQIFEKTLPENHPYTLQLRESVARCLKILENQ